MKHFVIGEDKGFEEAYTSSEVDTRVNAVNTALTNSINTTNNNVTTLQNNLKTTNNNVNAKQKAITSGTAAPSGGSNGDIYIQY